MAYWIVVPLAVVIGYVLGSIPVGIWICKAYGVDIRTVGSGRTGGTNAWRAAGLKAAIPTVLGDAFKGALAVWLVRWLFYSFFPDPAVMTVNEAVMRSTAVQLAAALAGGMAIIGHNWSMFNGFKGGAGGITSAGTAMAISPLVGSMVWLIGGIMIWWTAHRVGGHLCRRRQLICHLPDAGRKSSGPLALYHFWRHRLLLCPHRPPK